LDKIVGGALIALVVLLMLGCKAGPDYKRPTVDIPGSYRQTLAPDVAPASQTPSIADEQCTVIFQDPTLQRAQYFPQISLTSLGGAASNQLNAIASRPNAYWYAAGSISEPIFDGGRIRSNYRLSKAQEQEMLLDYQKTILIAGDQQGARGSQPHVPPTSGTARGSAIHADDVESRRTSLLPLGKVRHSFSQDAALHRDPRQLGSQTADLHLLGGHLRRAVAIFQRAFPMSLDPVEQRLLNHAQPARCSRDTLPDSTSRTPLLELERVPRPRRLNHLYPLR
jgi:hypothetical protein